MRPSALSTQGVKKRVHDHPRAPGPAFGGFVYPTFVNYVYVVVIITVGLVLVPACGLAGVEASDRAAAGYFQHGFEALDAAALKTWIDSIDLNRPTVARSISFDEPVSGSLYPPDMASPGFLWSGSGITPGAWLLRFATRRADLYVMVDRPWWVPPAAQWEDLKRLAGDAPVHLSAYAIGGWSMREVIAAGRTVFSISPDPVESKLAFMRKPLPFRKARDNPQLAQLLLAEVGSYGAPKVVLENQNVCFNCHGFSAGKNVFGMDMDVGGDKGGYVVKSMRPGNNWITDTDIISWNQLPAPAPAKINMGLFARPSPDGRFIAATVGESSVFVMIDDLYFSQLFFPASGRIACYDRSTGKVTPLPGADLPAFIQTGPAWSPDGQSVFFARARMRSELVAAVVSGQVRKESNHQDIDVLNRKYPIQFDIYRVPFNGGTGGSAQPLAGACANGMSNYFPRVSPDGRWVVFTQSPTGMVLQPQSRLCIVPAAGGDVRVLGCQTSVMNSWHSWSANGRWLAYASKVQSPYTEIFLTHIDAAGKASPAIRLFRLSSPGAAAMVPEFVAADRILFNSLKLATARQAPDRPASGNVR